MENKKKIMIIIMTMLSTIAYLTVLQILSVKLLKPGNSKYEMALFSGNYHNRFFKS